jgi:FKBP-type peptidyl-prolyl cis-trans isomerase FkpA
MKLLMISAALLIGALASAQTDLEKEKALSAEYLTKMAAETGATVIDMGVVLRPIYAAANEKFPTVQDTVTVSYHLADREGKLIEESITSDEAISFPLGRLIKCWQVAITKMSVGSFYKITCPSDSAYGDRGTSDGSIKGGAAITFRVTLFGFDKTL